MRSFFPQAFVTTALVIASAGGAFAQGQIRSPKLGLTLSVPSGWRVMEAPAVMDLDCDIAVTAQYDGFTPNIVVTDEVFSGSSDEYADGVTKSFGNQFSTSKLIKKSPFKTNSAIAGTKLVVRNTMQGRSMRQVFYLFPTRSGVMITLTVTSPVEQGFKHDKAMDNAMRKIRIDK